MAEAPTVDKTRTDKNKEGNDTVTDVPMAELKADAKRQGPVKNSDTVTGKGKSPASTPGSSDVAPIIKQNQNTDEPAISIVPPVYGHAGIKDVTKAKDDWAEAEAKAEARYGLPFLDSKTKEQRKDLIEAEYRRLHNGSLDEDTQTHHWGDSRQE